MKSQNIRYGEHKICKCGRPVMDCVCVIQLKVEKVMTEKAKLLWDLKKWHDIMREFMKEYPAFSGPHPDFFEWLKTYYQPPIRKK